MADYRVATPKPDNPEHKALTKSFPDLVKCIARSPGEITDQLVPFTIFSDEEMGDLRSSRFSEREKAQKIMDIVKSKVKSEPSFLNKFISIMEKCDWMKSCTDELKANLKAQKESQQSTGTSEQATGLSTDSAIVYTLIKDSDVSLLANHLGYLGPKFFQALSLSADDQKEVVKAYSENGAHSAMIRCLTLWKKHHPTTATYMYLLTVLLGLGQSLIVYDIISSGLVKYEAIHSLSEVSETNNVQLARDLWKAVQAEDVTEVISLLERGADPNHPLHWSEESILKYPPLHLACTRGLLEIVKALVTHGAHKLLWRNKSPLNYALEGGQKKVAQYLIQDDKERQSAITKVLTRPVPATPSADVNASSPPVGPTLNVPSAAAQSTDDVTLRMSHLIDILKVLKDARDVWYFIGQGIDCNLADLDEIQNTYPHNNLMSLQTMLQRRICQGGLTCTMLCESLRGEFVGRDDMAQTIEALDISSS